LADPPAGKVSMLAPSMCKALSVYCVKSNLTQYHVIDNCMCGNETFEGCKIRDNVTHIIGYVKRANWKTHLKPHFSCYVCRCKKKLVGGWIEVLL
jgi:hypothetical protein